MICFTSFMILGSDKYGVILQAKKLQPAFPNQFQIFWYRKYSHSSLKKQIQSPSYLKLLRVESVQNIVNVKFVFENQNPSTIKSVMVKQSRIFFKNKPKCLIFYYRMRDALRNQFVCTFASCTGKIHYLLQRVLPLLHIRSPSPSWVSQAVPSTVTSPIVWSEYSLK